MKRSIFHFLFIATITTSFQSDQSIKTNGVLTSEELKDAQEHALGDGNRLFVKKIDNILYIALAGEKKFWAHVYLSDSEILKVMHASAAIDAVEYYRNGTIWNTTDSFNYEIRNKVYNNDVESIMTNYLSAHGWVANNVNLGNGKTIEFKINMDQWKGSLYFACVMANYDMSFYSFPSKLQDDTLLPRLVQGYTPDSLHFETTKWSRIK